MTSSPTCRKQAFTLKTPGSESMSVIAMSRQQSGQNRQRIKRFQEVPIHCKTAHNRGDTIHDFLIHRQTCGRGTSK
jgi:hypothetical protein